MSTIYIITGPTAVGKTSLSIDWALENNAEIVSCDSLLFYRGMKIGTAKPSDEEMAKVQHHCVDLVPVSEAFNIARYLEIAEQVVLDIFERGKNVLVTGGSGFYLKGFVAPIYDEIEIPSRVVNEVLNLFENEGLEGLVRELQKVSPDDYDLIDLQNSRRVIPALKRCLASGKSVGELRAKAQKADFPFKKYQKKSLLLKRSPDSLKERISMRAKLMLEGGLIEEVLTLLSAGIEENPSAALSIGYREVISHIRGEIDADELEELISKNTLKLAKKQIKWFRRQMSFDRVLDLDIETPDVGTLF